MYPDPKLVRINRVTTRFDQYEYGVLEAIANFKGIQPAVLVREIAVQAALELVSFPPDQDNRATNPNPAAQKHL